SKFFLIVNQSADRMHSGRSSSMSNRTSSTVRFNPITGEEKVFEPPPADQQGPISRPSTRPKGVPPLPIGSQDNNSVVDYRRTKSGFQRHQQHQQTPPDNASSISWGSGSEADVLSVKSNEFGERAAAPRGVPQLEVRTYGHQAQRHHDQQQQQRFRGTGAVNRGIKIGPYEDDDLASLASGRSAMSSYSSTSSRTSQTSSGQSPSFDDSASTVSSFRSLSLSNRPPASEDAMNEASKKVEIFERLWASRQDKSNNELLRRLNKEEELEARRRESILDAVMVDQLSRAPMCDPEQETNRSDVSVNQALQHVPGMPRGSIRHLHHSKIRTANSATEQLLSDRVRFTVRIITASGNQDAIRELTGFFFALDSTFTVYEFKTFGKTSKALPFVKRGHYRAAWGRKRGQPYTVFDLWPGNTLYIATDDQPGLPKSTRACAVLKLRVSEVDDPVRKKLIETLYMSGKDLTASQYARLHVPTDSDELNQVVQLEQVQKHARSLVRRRAVATLTGLFSHCRRMDEEGRDQLPRHELELALKKFRMHGLTDEQLDRVWDACDPEMTSFADYYAYLCAVFGEMDETVKRLVMKAFLKMDTAKSGAVSFADIGRFYRATSHPSVLQGESSQANVLKNFLDGFSNFIQRKETVSAIEFIVYYEGLGIQLDDDVTLAEIVRNCWNV
ncbi:hypothetical protein BOX15_Mlig004055g1, partial [Macrostomum lignano]